MIPRNILEIDRLFIKVSRTILGNRQLSYFIITPSHKPIKTKQNFSTLYKYMTVYIVTYYVIFSLVFGYINYVRLSSLSLRL